MLGFGRERDTKAQNVGRNWSEGKIERALGLFPAHSLATWPPRADATDFRWGRFNFDTDVEGGGPRRLSSGGGPPKERGSEDGARQEIAVQDEH